MNPAGYSGKPLVQKLGYQAGDSVYLVAAPPEFQMYLESEGLHLHDRLPATWLHVFFATRKDIEDFLQAENLDNIEKGLWVSWPKKSSGIQTDVSEQIFRDYILPLEWVDTKVAAIDDTWSGLKFLRRKK